LGLPKGFVAVEKLAHHEFAEMTGDFEGLLRLNRWISRRKSPQERRLFRWCLLWWQIR
jgi:hypothetical protein